MVDRRILSHDMKSSFPECYMTFWSMTNNTHSFDQTLTRDLITELDLITDFDLFAEFRELATDTACQQRTLTPPDNWSCPTFGLACVLSEINFSQTCLVSGLLSFEHPSVFLFLLVILKLKSSRLS